LSIDASLAFDLNECEWKMATALRPLPQCPLTLRQAQVAEGLLGVQPSTV